MDGFAVRSERYPGAAADRRADRRRRARAARARGRARRWASRRAVSCPTVPTPSSPSSTLSRVTTVSRSEQLLARVTTCALEVATLLRAMSSCREARASGPRRSVHLLLPGSSTCRSRGARASRCSRPARSFARPGEPLGPGEVYEANGVLLATAFASAGADVERFRPSPTTRRRTGVRSSRGLAADVLVTSGGVSVGPHDLVRGLLAELGVEEIFWGVAVKPGKPLAFGVRGSTLVFGLPGNPVSSLVGAEVFVRPALLALQGATRPRSRVLRRASLASAIRRNTQRDEFRSCALRSVRRRCRARAGHGSGVAHDRARRGGGRARARASRRRRARRRRARCATCRSPELSSSYGFAPRGSTRSSLA